MKSALILSALASSVSAFAPVAKTTSTTALNANTVFDNYVGAKNFMGQEMKFDPLSLSETFEPWQGYFRESELRHGRTAMLAVLGFWATDFVRIPGDMYSFSSIPKTIDAHDALKDNGPLMQLFFWIGLFDICVTAPAIQALGKGEREAGDFGLTGFAPKDKAAFDKKRESELLNGRLAMCAVGGIATQSVLTGHGFPYL